VFCFHGLPTLLSLLFVAFPGGFLLLWPAQVAFFAFCCFSVRFFAFVACQLCFRCFFAFPEGFLLFWPTCFAFFAF